MDERDQLERCHPFDQAPHQVAVGRHPLESGVEADPDQPELVMDPLQLVVGVATVEGFDDPDCGREVRRVPVPVGGYGVVDLAGVGHARRPQVLVGGDHDRLVHTVVVHHRQAGLHLRVVPKWRQIEFEPLRTRVAHLGHEGGDASHMVMGVDDGEPGPGHCASFIDIECSRYSAAKRRCDPIGEDLHELERVVHELAHDQVGGTGRRHFTDPLHAPLRGSRDHRAAGQEFHQAQFPHQLGIGRGSIRRGVDTGVVAAA